MYLPPFCGMGALDDMNHLKNKRIRSVEDLLQDQFGLALAIQQGDSEIAEAWFDQAAEYWKQAIALTPGLCSTPGKDPPDLDFPSRKRWILGAVRSGCWLGRFDGSV
ncbi:hypothetical protein KY285_000798 [Solanum tuberosum]|nr:hypothetical protein KY285_000798 [Solanum tuberosum]